MAYNTLIELTNPGAAFQPSHDFVLIQPVEAPGRTNGGIILPNGSRAPTKTGPIVAVGPGNISPFGQMIPMDHKVGDVVVFNPMAHIMEVKVGDVTYLLGRDCDCLGKVLEGKPQDVAEQNAAGPAPVKTASTEAGTEENTTFAVEASRN